jgi:hypothetical protein
MAILLTCRNGRKVRFSWENDASLLLGAYPCFPYCCVRFVSDDLSGRGMIDRFGKPPTSTPRRSTNSMANQGQSRLRPCADASPLVGITDYSPDSIT